MMGLEVVKEITASDIIGWMLAFMGGVIVFKIVDGLQTSLARHTVIKEIEKSVNELFALSIAKSNKKNIENKLKLINEVNTENALPNVNLRTILHDNSPWEEYTKTTNIIIEGDQRYIQIRKSNGYNEYIGTRAIHELLILFRRIEKLYKDSIIKQIDLADMWREILPFGINGRLEFFKTYLHENDIKAIVFVLFNTVLACEKYEIKNAVNYFRKNYIKNEIMKTYYISNSRYTVKEKLKIKKFQKLMNLL